MDYNDIGRYEVKAELGRGGMATVYRAYDPRFERNIAIKVLPRALLHDPQFRKRFDREAKMIAMLEHPAIVPVYDFGEQDEQPYIVMRYMSGGSLADRLEEGPVSPEETLRIIKRLAPALDAAHAQGIIHRDIKPANILFDQYGNAFLSDFGIARLAQHAEGTLTGDAIIGTPAYMSPEQVQGDKEIDGRSDIYSLGIILFQMLTGDTPFQADTPAKTMMMHLLEPIPHALEFNPALPTGCESVITRALAKKPDDRYVSTDELAADLESSYEGHFNQTMKIAPSETLIATPPTADRQSQPETILSAHKELNQAVQPQANRRGMPTLLLAIILGGLLLLGGGSITLLGFNGSGPLAMLAGPAASPTPTTDVASEPSPTTAAAVDLPATETDAALATDAAFVPVSPTETLAPTEAPTDIPTETPTPEPQAPIVGGADMVAFLNDNDVWAANLDGSELVQLTSDGAVKTNLQWMPDGESIDYILGKCIQSVNAATGGIEIVACFEVADYLETFEISPDGSQVAISLNRELYVVPYDLEALNQARLRTDLRDMASCTSLSPYSRSEGQTVAVKSLRWSKDGQKIAIVFLGVSFDGRQVDLIDVLDVSQCTPLLPRLDEFPAGRFSMEGYDTQPRLQNFAWDGDRLFALFSFIRNDGFGDLWIYNTETHHADQIRHITNGCCYRDPQFSPDGRYLLFAYQDRSAAPTNIINLYYIQLGTIGSGLTYDPIPLPDDFFADPHSKPQPALRTVENFP